MICSKCYSQGIENTIRGGTFFYCRTCKDEIKESKTSVDQPTATIDSTKLLTGVNIPSHPNIQLSISLIQTIKDQAIERRSKGLTNSKVRVNSKDFVKILNELSVAYSYQTSVIISHGAYNIIVYLEQSYNIRDFEFIW